MVGRNGGGGRFSFWTDVGWTPDEEGRLGEEGCVTRSVRRDQSRGSDDLWTEAETQTARKVHLPGRNRDGPRPDNGEHVSHKV